MQKLMQEQGISGRGDGNDLSGEIEQRGLVGDVRARMVIGE